MKRIHQEDYSIYSEKIIHWAKIPDPLRKREITQSQTGTRTKICKVNSKTFKGVLQGRYPLRSLIHTKKCRHLG